MLGINELLYWVIQPTFYSITYGLYRLVPGACAVSYRPRIIGGGAVSYSASSSSTTAISSAWRRSSTTAISELPAKRLLGSANKNKWVLFFMGAFDSHKKQSCLTLFPLGAISAPSESSTQQLALLAVFFEHHRELQRVGVGFTLYKSGPWFQGPTLFIY